MTGMGLVSQTDSTPERSGRKRVRFEVPDTDEEKPDKKDNVKRASYRIREKGEFLKAKRRLPPKPPKPSKPYPTCKPSKLVKRDTAPVTGFIIFDIDKEVGENDDQVYKTAKRRRQDGAENVNFNCSSKGKKNDSNEKNDVNDGKGNSNDYLSKCVKKKSKKKVVSKKAYVKYNTWCCVKCALRNKRKVSRIMKQLVALKVGATKKRKLWSGDSKKRGQLKNTCLENSTVNHICNIIKAVPTFKLKLAVKAYRAKRTKTLVKKATEKLHRARQVERKGILKKFIERKKALKRKADLRHKIAQKRKDMMAVMAERKESCDIPRKVRIIPIEREEEVSEDLRINLLKFRTFEKAHQYQHECCGQYCWDRWQELDIDDVLADFE